jgi:hypothetical protein
MTVAAEATATAATVAPTATATVLAEGDECPAWDSASSTWLAVALSDACAEDDGDVDADAVAELVDEYEAPTERDGVRDSLGVGEPLSDTVGVGVLVGVMDCDGVRDGDGGFGVYTPGARFAPVVTVYRMLGRK